MNFELHDILSNPALLNHVPDETLQTWIDQYPYISLFQLYALKRKKNYSESDLHKTAFYFNNREKLYFLLKSDRLNFSPEKQKENIFNSPAREEIIDEPEERETGIEENILVKEEIETESIADKNIPDNEEIGTEYIELVEQLPLSLSYKEEISHTKVQVEDKFPENHSPFIEEEIIYEEKTTVTEPVNEIVPEKEVGKSYSIADEVIAEIQRIKEARAKRLAENGDVSITGWPVAGKVEEKNTTEDIKLIDQPEEFIAEITEEVELSELIEEETQEDQNESQEKITEEIVGVIEIENPGIQDKTMETLEDEIVNQETEITPEATEQNEIAAIEIPEQEIVEQQNEMEVIQEKEIVLEEEKQNETETEITEEEIIPEQIEQEKEKVELNAKTISEEHEKEVAQIENREEISASSKEEQKEKPLTVAEQVIAQLQKIKKERALKLLEDHAPVKEDEKEKVEEEITPPLTEITELPVIAEDNVDPLTNIAPVYPTPEPEKEIELVEDNAFTEQEKEDVDALAQLHAPIPTSFEDEKNSISEELPEKTTEEKSEQEDIQIVPPAEEKLPAEEHREIAIDEKQEHELQHEESVEIKRTASPVQARDSSIYIPDIEEDKIEEHIEPEVITDKETPVETKTLTSTEQKEIETEEKQTEITQEEKVLEEKTEEKIQQSTPPQQLNPETEQQPHTFIEWLQMLDGNLQIQTTEKPKEEKEWIEIPRYEVDMQQQIKKQEQQESDKQETEQKTLQPPVSGKREEKKFFEPNFEEGEVDLFNEIDEEVTKVASESVSFKSDMMTETLAKIYEKQGKIDKAMEIYNALRLKFPEKSGYFAALIQKLEKEK